MRLIVIKDGPVHVARKKSLINNLRIQKHVHLYMNFWHDGFF